MKALSYSDALSRMAALCSTGEHCERDVREKLQRVAVSETDIQRIVDYLRQERYLDDARYCRAFVRDRLRFAHWGRLKIQQALRAHGLPEADIQNALNALNSLNALQFDEAGTPGTPDLPADTYRQVLRDVLQQKDRTLRDSDPRTRRAKLIRFALGRGFTMDEIMDELS